jgi:aspartate aminotransferase
VTVSGPGLAAVQWRFDELRAEAVRRHGGRVLDLSYANPSVEIDARLRSALVDAASTMSAAAFQYSPYGGATKPRRLVATRLAQRTNLPFTYRDVVLTAGATAALSTVFAAAFTRADEVVLFRPSWIDYPLFLQQQEVGWRFVDLTPCKRLDLDELADALDPSTAGVVLSQPQSPTGVVLSAAELRALANVLERASARAGRSILLVSDEAHRDVKWAADTVPSPVDVYDNTVIIYSFGKAWRMQGQRIGYAAVSPRSPVRAALADALVHASRAMGLGCPSTLMQEVVSRLLSLEPEMSWLRNAQLYARGVLAAAGYEVVDAQATAFVYARAPTDDEWGFVRELAHRGVLVLPSALFHDAGHFRLALNVGRRELEPIATAFSDCVSAA